MTKNPIILIAVFILLLTILSTVACANETKLPSTNSWGTIVQPIQPQQEQQSPSYPTQTTPDPKVLWDYRAPTYDIYTYDIYTYDKAPIE